MIRNGFLIFLKKLTKNYKIGLYKKNSSCKIKNVTIEFNPWGFSSAGRASALHAEGQEFESPNLQIFKRAVKALFWWLLAIIMCQGF